MINKTDKIQKNTIKDIKYNENNNNNKNKNKKERKRVISYSDYLKILDSGLSLNLTS